MPRGKPISEDIKKRVLQALSEGQSQTSIAAEFGMQQPQISYIQKRAAIKIGGGETTTSKNIKTLSFIEMAMSSFQDATSWRDISASATSIELQIAINTAESASVAWKEAADKLKERK